MANGPYDSLAHIEPGIGSQIEQADVKSMQADWCRRHKEKAQCEVSEKSRCYDSDSEEKFSIAKLRLVLPVAVQSG